MRQAQQAYIHQAEEKIMQLETVEHENGEMAVRVLHGDAVVMPTTAELTDYVHDAATYQEIQKLQTNCLQQSEEKVAIARQAYEMMDAVVQ
jgi:GTP cyclohydrolase III